MNKHSNVFVFILLFSISAIAQNDTLPKEKFDFDYEGYLEMFYSPNRSFLPSNSLSTYHWIEVNHNRSRSVAVNLALAGVRVEKNRFRANLLIQGGSYVTDNYANEEPGVRFLHEANLMYSPIKNEWLWIEAGILPSFVGAETAIGADNYTLTRNYISENTPYYLTGAAMRIETQNLLFRLGVYNGWERITRQFDNVMSFGAQAQVKFDFLKLNYSILMGRDNKMRETLVSADTLFVWGEGAYNHNNFYADISPVKGWNILVGYDFTLNIGSSMIERIPMTSFFVTNRIVFSKRVAMANRFETFKSTFYTSYTDLWSISTNFDFTLSPNVILRAEARSFNINRDIFPEGFLPNKTGDLRIIFALIGRL